MPPKFDDFLGADKALHFAASAGITLFSYSGSAYLNLDGGNRLLLAGTTVLAIGALKEVVFDFALGHGKPSLLDFTWDVFGAMFGLATAAITTALLGGQF